MFRLNVILISVKYGFFSFSSIFVQRAMLYVNHNILGEAGIKQITNGIKLITTCVKISRHQNKCVCD